MDNFQRVAELIRAYIEPCNERCGLDGSCSICTEEALEAAQALVNAGYLSFDRSTPPLPKIQRHKTIATAKQNQSPQSGGITPEQAQAHLLNYEYEIGDVERRALETIAASGKCDSKKATEPDLSIDYDHLLHLVAEMERGSAVTTRYTWINLARELLRLHDERTC